MWWLIGAAIIGSSISSASNNSTQAIYDKAILFKVDCAGKECPIPFDMFQGGNYSPYEEDNYSDSLRDNPYTVYIPQRNAYYFYDKSKKVFIAGNINNCGWSGCGNNKNTVIYDPRTRRFSLTNKYQGGSLSY